MVLSATEKALTTKAEPNPTAVDWSELPPELIQTIAEKLITHTDYLRFRAVSTTWRLSTPTAPLHLPTQLPWLMLPFNQTRRSTQGATRHLLVDGLGQRKKITGASRPFFSLSANKSHSLHLPESSPHRRRRHRGSSHGYLAFLDESPDFFLLNPLTRAKFSLPPLSSFPNVVAFDFSDVGREYSLRAPNGDVSTRSLSEMRDLFIKKVVLSSSPSVDLNFIVLAILNQTGDLAFCKNGYRSWLFIEDAQSYCEDAIYCNGLFYAVNKLGQIAVCDVTGEFPRVSFICTPPQIGGDLLYLVSLSSDELLLVTRYLDLEILDYGTREFRVYRLDLSGPKWERVTSLGDQMLFLGENSSVALSASDFPGCKGNCIYYTDDYSELNYDGMAGNHDLGVYNLEDGSIDPLPCCYSLPRMRWPPIWVTPNPC
ncbi:hypothetical protein RHMOL_Rhmol06G0019600 [Rhododendron molle]|uniref:Uncharacterized protein n=2 Tax=Rhododendron molle TaxID=49168 RepID=A0ACC0N8G8_RHOML|nr:hypothetical protein RHMOL_Rhmol06G0019600 [Rhododendron molle]KAI8549375.1 hypothetical protein RHMOL_Rhmol06G0019600 [Rhododendron molle]